MQKTNKIYTNMIFVTFAALLCTALWGSATPAIKIGYELLLPERNVASIMLFAGIRFTLAGLITIIIYSLARRKFLYPKKESYSKVAIIGCFQTVIQYIFFYIGLANTTGVKGTILSGSNVFFAIIIAALIFKQEKITLKKIIGCILGFAGIIVVNLKGLDLKMNFFGDCFVLFSAISYAVSSVLMKRYSQDEDPVVLSGYQFVLGGLFMVAVGLCFGGQVMVSSMSGFWVLIYLSFLSAVAYSVWGILLKHNPVSRVTVFSFTIPVFGVVLSYLLLKSEDSAVDIVNLLSALVLICSGVFILNYKKN